MYREQVMCGDAMRVNKIIGMALLSAMSACASYAPQPLPEHIETPNNVLAVKVDPAVQARWTTHVYDPSNGLDSEELAMLAVANNPALRAARAQLGVARAQAFSSGLLADPQLIFAEDFAMTPGTQNAWAYGLGFDVGDWLMRSSRQRVAQAGVTQAEQSLLWQEWQVVNQAKLLFVHIQTQQLLLALLYREQQSLQAQSLLSAHALAEANITLEVANTDRIAWQVVTRQVDEQQRIGQQNHAQLTALLGVSPDAEVSLVGDTVLGSVDVNAVRAELTHRLNQRPDMAALRAGYAAQEAGYRATVLAQFPMFSLGLTRAQDNFGVNSIGPSFSLSVPIFNRNRGNIAVARASREQLYQEYQARWLTAQSDVMLALANYTLLRQQWRTMQQDLPALQVAADAAVDAEHVGNVLGALAVRMQLAYLDKQMDVLNVRQALAEQLIALQAELGNPLP